MSIMDILFGKRKFCLICSGDEKVNEHLCAECIERVEIVNESGELKFDPPIEFWYSVIYNSFTRSALLKFKFNGANYLGKAFGEIMGETTLKILENRDIDIIIPVPMHRRALNKRGYNQTELLAKKVAYYTKIPLVLNSLIKGRNTKTQSSLDMTERKINLKNAFIINNKAEIKGKRVLLIDDIITTGATIKECRDALLNGGAKEVIALSLTVSSI